MTAADFNIRLLMDQRAEEVFRAVNEVKGWWSEDFTGSALRAGDEFEVRFGDVHYSRQRLIEIVPDKKIVWLVTDSCLHFVADKKEWTTTRICFDISPAGKQTQIHFTHVGLRPQMECFRDCSRGWKYYIQQSLLAYITTGKGQPNAIRRSNNEQG